MRAQMSACGLTQASRCVRTCATAPGVNAVSGVLSVSTSLLNTHMCPAARRRSSPRFRRSTRAEVSVEMSWLGLEFNLDPVRCKGHRDYTESTRTAREAPVPFQSRRQGTRYDPRVFAQEVAAPGA